MRDDILMATYGTLNSIAEVRAYWSGHLGHEYVPSSHSANLGYVAGDSWCFYRVQK